MTDPTATALQILGMAIGIGIGTWIGTNLAYWMHYNDIELKISLWFRNLWS